MKIGTDVSLAECRDSGYLVIEFKKRELIKKGVLQKDVCVHCTISNPEAWENGRPLIGFTTYDAKYPLYLVDTWYDWDAAIETFEQYEKEILSMCGFKNRDEYQIDFENPDEYDLLHLLSDISAYCGLE
jgi:hypothetical protein